MVNIIFILIFTNTCVFSLLKVTVIDINEPPTLKASQTFTIPENSVATSGAYQPSCNTLAACLDSCRGAGYTTQDTVAR